LKIARSDRARVANSLDATERIISYKNKQD